MKTIAIIRERGQLTIPDPMRKLLGWANPDSVVTISITNSNEILIKSHEKQLDSAKIWSLVNASRSIKSSTDNKESTAQFLERDRRSH